MKTLSTKVLKSKINKMPVLQITEPVSLNDIIFHLTKGKIDERINGTFLCNESCDTNLLNMTVEMVWDKNNNCPGLYIDNVESFINIIPPDNMFFDKYYCTDIGFNELTAYYDIFAKFSEVAEL